MEIITFQCDKCNKVMRIGADKAGRRGKCSRCGHKLIIPATSQPISAPLPQRPGGTDDDDDEGGIYGFADSLDADKAQEEEEEAKSEIEKLYSDDEDEEEDEDEDEDEDEEDEEEEQLRLIAKRRREAIVAMRKAPMDVRQWEKIRLGVILVMIGMGFWLAAVLLQKLVFLFGIGHSDEYAVVAARELLDPNETPEIGQVPTLYRARFIVGLIGGSDMIEVNLWLYRISYLFILIQLVATATGYIFCISAPNRFGAKGLAIALLPLVAISFVLTLTLKLLPLAGAYNYTMIQLLGPEVAIVRANIERMVAIHIFWSAAPFAESLLSILLHLTTFGELALFCIFLRSIAKILKDEQLEPPANALIRLILGVGFSYMAFLLLINTGTTEVMINILWGVYLLTTFFYIWFLIWYLMVLWYTIQRIYRAIRDY